MKLCRPREKFINTDKTRNTHTHTHTLWLMLYRKAWNMKEKNCSLTWLVDLASANITKVKNFRVRKKNHDEENLLFFNSENLLFFNNFLFSCFPLFTNIHHLTLKSLNTQMQLLK